VILIFPPTWLMLSKEDSPIMAIAPSFLLIRDGLEVSMDEDT